MTFCTVSGVTSTRTIPLEDMASLGVGWASETAGGRVITGVPLKKSTAKLENTATAITSAMRITIIFRFFRSISPSSSRKRNGKGPAAHRVSHDTAAGPVVFYYASGSAPKGAGGSPRRPKRHSMASTMRRQA